MMHGLTRRMLLPLLLGVAAPALAQGANTDVYLAPITRIGDSIIVGTPVNVTGRAGYDNQPAFTPDSRALLYVAQSEGQTDVWRYDIATRRTTRITATPESEYSPTPVPGESRFSVVRVERDSTQRVWSFGMNGGAPRLVLSSLKPVGYHGWLDARRLAAYVLGTPSTLHLINRDGTRDAVIARDVGRAVQPLPPGANAMFSFTQRDSANRLRVFIYTGRTEKRRYGHDVVSIPRTGPFAGQPTKRTVVDSVVNVVEQPYELVAAPADNEFHAWTPDVILVTATASALVRWNAVLGAGSAWLPVADLKPFGVKNVSRLAFSADGEWLAFVAEPAGQ